MKATYRELSEILVGIGIETGDREVEQRIGIVRAVGGRLLGELEDGCGGTCTVEDVFTFEELPLVARVEHVLQPPMPPEGGGDHVKALVSEILSTLRDIIRINPLFEQNISFFARKMDVSNPYNLADFATSLTSMEAKDLQDVLETLPLQERLEKALFALRKELQSKSREK
jgi:ATP-dependent Lon protease